MNSHGNNDLHLIGSHGEEISGGRSLMIETEESVSIDSIQNKGLEHEDRTCPETQNGARGKSHVEFTQSSSKINSEERDSVWPKIAKIEEFDSDPFLENEGHLVSGKGSIHCQHLSDSSEIGDRVLAVDWNTAGKYPMIRKIPTLNQYDSSAPDNDQFGNSDVRNSKDGSYFYYDAPFYEDTGVWIPVSIPPMSEREREEWTRGFCSNGGYISEGDMGWSQFTGEDKQLTLWDVVLDMILVARGKVGALASGDIRQISWISANLIEKAWYEMAQTVTEATLNNTQEIFESEPPKWLPDSAASSCMLCSVRFHPIMFTRHHCRFCGGIFCNGCTKGRSLLPEKFHTGDPQM